MMGVIIWRLVLNERWMYRNFYWNYVGYIFLTGYHFWFLTPISLMTGINVATMTAPPDPLLILGFSYRIIWTLCCGLLQFLSVSLLQYLSSFPIFSPQTSNSKNDGVNGCSKKIS
mmetsp:Transcript_13451/g.20029  ORF Transcript_13451/g.20029 Transcript_13451/m.20029 type:complete len:115 (-) Transcript_13451:65-409(-)